MEQFMHRDAIISVAFAGSEGSDALYVGKIINIHDDFLEIQLDEKQPFTVAYYKKTAGKMLLNKKYLVSIVLE